MLFRMKPFKVLGFVYAICNVLPHFDLRSIQNQFFILQNIQLTVRKPIESERFSHFKQFKQLIKIILEILQYNVLQSIA